MSNSDSVEGLVERLKSEFHDYDCHALRLEASEALKSMQKEIQQLVGHIKAKHDFTVQAEAERDRLSLEVERLRRALQTLVYETTHLSPQNEDGSHDCRISKAALEAARAALGKAEAQPFDANTVRIRSLENTVIDHAVLFWDDVEGE